MMFDSSLYFVRKIPNKETYPFLLNIHYAKRIPSISYSYGLYKITKSEICSEDTLVGVVTYGTPSSSTLRTGIAGKHNAKNVLELNRLCLLNNIKNEASFLVGKSLRMLQQERGDTIVVSYADTSQNHEGIVYRACNFLYTGLSAKRTDYKIKGKEHLHGQTISDEFRGIKNRTKALREKYGEDFYLQPRPRKHRYVFVLGNKKFKKRIIKELRYKVIDWK